MVILCSVMETNRLNINTLDFIFLSLESVFFLLVKRVSKLLNYSWMTPRTSTATTRRRIAPSQAPGTCTKLSTFPSDSNARVSLFYSVDLLCELSFIILDSFSGYGIQREQKNCIYKTTSSDYGYFTPSPHSVPTRFERQIS
jgi:hypothetical protein